MWREDVKINVCLTKSCLQGQLIPDHFYYLTKIPQTPLTLNSPDREKKPPDYINPFQYHMTYQPCVGDIAHYLPDLKTIHKKQPI